MFVLGLGVGAATRRALVVGLGEQEDKSWGKINGDKDVGYVTAMLSAAGFERCNVTTLVNREASKAAIVAAFGELARQSGPGDVVYVHFSGHGQQMRDVHNDEHDGLDECWIPYDAYRSPCERDRGEKHLTDDEVNRCLNAVRDRIGDSGKMLVVIDACHSGDGTRGDEDEVVRGVEEVFSPGRSHEWDAPVPHEAVVWTRTERWLTLSACKSSQVNVEMRDPVVGKLTYALCEEARKCGAADSNEALFARLRKFVNRNTASRPQQPVMSGEKNRFSITDIIRRQR